jgi:ABC-type multidrug transport system fused ATPase/permease subunit
MAGSVGGLADTYGQIQKAIGSTEHLLDIIDEQPEYEKPFEAGNIQKVINGKISFENVSFSYPSRKDFPVLKQLNFTVNPGEQVAIVGPSGAGKSTLTAMILRFYPTDEGKIYIDDIPVNEFDLGTYRSQVALVPQDIILFGGTIRENIRYSKPNATDEEILEAAQKANAHDFIMEFPEQYDTVVGERGTKLSGGQRQRIAIARAVLSDPAILLLDEATSSLDSESERLVQDALDKLMMGRTSIVIAHRLSTIRNADKILVIDKGELKESGTHEELIRKEQGLYRYLTELQFGV